MCVGKVKLAGGRWTETLFGADLGTWSGGICTSNNETKGPPTLPRALFHGVGSSRLAEGFAELLGGVTTVYCYGLACQESSLVGGKKHNHLRNFLHGAATPGRYHSE